MTNREDPVNIAGFRAKREARERTRKACEPGPGYAVNEFDRIIPPPLNPDIPRMVKEVKACYLSLGQQVATFQDAIVELVDAGRLDPGEQPRLLEHYGDLQNAVHAATVDAPKGEPGDRPNDYFEDGTWNRGVIHRFADHAKYVYAVGARDIAALQYRLSELAHTGRLDPDANQHLQRDHCQQTWEVLYYGTTCAVRDARTWDGLWDWYDNTYSDGRQIMLQARVKNWPELEYSWPSEGICGDGPIQEYPRGSVCQIHPVIEPGSDGEPVYYPSMEIDLTELVERLGPLSDGGTAGPQAVVGSE